MIWRVPRTITVKHGDYEEGEELYSDKLTVSVSFTKTLFNIMYIIIQTYIKENIAVEKQPPTKTPRAMLQGFSN
jgi:hypothetical protein